MKTPLLLTGAKLLDPELREPQLASLLLQEGRIAARLAFDAQTPDGARQVDLSGLQLAPGFLDLHFHGDLIFAPPDALGERVARCAETRLAEGVTGFLATTVAWDQARLRRVIDALVESASQGGLGSTSLLGVHLEGPWINPAAAGAQPAAGIRSPESEEVEATFARSHGLLRLVTLAPELPGAIPAIERLRDQDVCVAAGHSLANDAELDAACRAGLTHVTHLFNAMGSMRQRQPGLAGLALADDRLSCDLICDGVHVHESWARTAARAKGERLCLITDRIELPADGSGAGALGFGSGAVADDGRALRLADGRLAGSSLALDRALRNAIEMRALAELDAIAACTLRPARVLGIEAERGTLRPGARADLVVLGPGLEVAQTWVAGECRYAREPARRVGDTL